MIGDTLTVTIDSVAKVLSKINQDNYSATYYLRDGTVEYTAAVSHVLPTSKNGNLESHKVALTVVTYDSEDVKLSTEEFWTVARTSYGRQPSGMDLNYVGFVDLQDATFIGKVLARES